MKKGCSDSVDLVSMAEQGKKGEAYYNKLLEECKERLKFWKKQKPIRAYSLSDAMEENEVERRDFMKWAAATTGMLMLPSSFTPLVAESVEMMNRLPVIWIELQDCAGNTEAITRSDGPKIDELVLDVISLEYNETLMAAAGFQAEKQLEEAIEHFKGKYILVVEGAIPLGMDGYYGTIGPYGETFEENLKRVAKDAAAVVAVGACAAFGGVPAASPNPTDAKGVMHILNDKPIINIPACPANPANIVGTIINFMLTGNVPELDSLLRPKFAFGYRIHDNCERRAHFDAGEFVEEWGDHGAKHNWCLYKMGCKGPMTFNNCSIVRYNERANWPIGGGHGCIGCSEPDFWDLYAYERPMADAHIKVPAGGVEKTVDEVGVGLVAATAVGIGAHAVASHFLGSKCSDSSDGDEK